MQRLSRLSVTHPVATVACWLAILVLALLMGWTGRDRLISRLDEQMIGDPSVMQELDRAGSVESSTIRCAVDGAPIGRDLRELRAGPIDAIEAAQISQAIGACYLAKWGRPVPELPDAPGGGGNAGRLPVVPLVSARMLTDWLVAETPRAGNESPDATMQRALVRAERFALPIALLVLLLTLRDAIRALLTVLTGGLTCLIAIGALTFWAQRAPVSMYVLSIVSMLGLALGTDYALFWFSRYGRATGSPRERAAETAETVSPIIAKAAATIAACSLGLLVIPLSLFRDVALGVMVVCLAAWLLAATWLPACMTLVPERLQKLPNRDPHRAGSLVGCVWSAGFRSMRRAACVGAVVLAVLILLATGVHGMQLGLSMEPVRPAAPASRETATVTADGDVYATYVQDEATAAWFALVDIGFVGERASQEAASLLGFFAKDDDFAPIVVEETVPDVPGVRIRAIIVRPAGSAEAIDAIGRLQEHVAAMTPDARSRFAIGGASVAIAHLVLAIARHQWQAAGLAGVVMALALFALHRRPVLALAATIGSCLSFLAGLGVLVLVCQRGVLGWHPLLPVPFIERWVPIVMVCVIAGMSVDYHVFVMSGRVSRGRAGLVQRGIAEVAPVVVAAAAIMALVFGSCVMSGIPAMQQVGIGLAAAILIDALAVRLVLMPTMAMVLARESGPLSRGVRAPS